MPSVYRILIADPIHEQARNLLTSRPGFEVAIATGLNEAELAERIGTYDGIIIRSKTRLTAPLVAAGQKLKVIGRAGIGVDNIDVAAATERGIVVLNTPDANATTTAELALAHLLSLSRHLPQADRSMRAGEWQPAKFVGHRTFRQKRRRDWFRHYWPYLCPAVHWAQNARPRIRPIRDAGDHRTD